jgi:DNA-directed RNA polymerase specialized sigma24 family protein
VHKCHTSKAFGQSSSRDLANDDELNAAFRQAFRRIFSWRIPPNWSAHDWLDEVKAITAAACCQAEFDFDFKHGVPLSAFLYRRALTCAWTRYRQEWAYALRFMQEDGAKRYDDVATPRTSLPEVCPPDDSLRCALLELPFTDQWLVRQLFWNGMTEDKVARNLKITQQAVSKRKKKIIRKLRHLLRDIHAALLGSATLFWSAVAKPIEPLLSCDLWL